MFCEIREKAIRKEEVRSSSFHLYGEQIGSKLKFYEI